MNFLSFFRNDLKRMFTSYGFWFAFVLFSLYNIYHFYQATVLYSASDIYNSIPANMAFTLYYATFGYPTVSMAIILCGLPFSASFVSDVKCRILPILLTKFTRIQYLTSHILTVFIGSFLAVILPLLLNQALCLSCFEFKAVIDNFYLGPSNYNIFDDAAVTIFPKLFVFHPYLYNLLFSFLLAVTCSFLGVLGFAFTLFFNRFRVVAIAIPYVFFILTSLFDSLARIGEITPFSNKPTFSLSIFLTGASSGLKNTGYIFIIELTAIVVFTISAMIRFCRNNDRLHI